MTSVLEEPRHLSRRQILQAAAAAGTLAIGLPFASSLSAGRRTAVVVGAGVAGLSAAWQLQKAGFEVVVFEKSDFPGGRMREAWMGPLWGPPHALGVFQANREMFALAAQLNIANLLEGETESEAYDIDNGHGIYQRGLRFHIDEVGRVPGLSESTRSRLPRLEKDLSDIAQRVDPCLLATGAEYDDESIAEYFRRVLGAQEAREVLEYWVEVVLESWGWPAESTSRIPLLSWFAQRDAKIVVPRGGIGVLTRTLAAHLNVKLGTTVRYISPPDSGGRHTVHYLDAARTRKNVAPDVAVSYTHL